MEFKSQICTTKEQSDRLLALGLKPETSDMEIEIFKGNNTISGYVSKGYWNNEISDALIELIPAWSLHRLMAMMPPSIKDGYHYSLIYNIHRDAIEYICFANGGMQRPYNRLLWDTQSTDAFENIIVCFEWLIKAGCFNKDYLEEKK